LTIEDRYKADLHKNEYIRTSNGFYSYKYVDIYGERKVITSKSLEGLRKKEKVIEAEKEFRDRAMRQDLTISEILELYYNSRKEHPNTQGKSNNTLKANENVIKIINGYKFSQYKSKKLARQDAEDFIESLADKYKYNTIKQVHSFLKAAFSYAIDSRYTDVNIFNFNIKGASSTKESLTLEQQENFLRFISNHHKYRNFYLWVVILIETGLRISEFLALTKDCIDFEKKKLYVKKQIDDKGRITDILKTEKARRSVTLSDKACDCLYEVMENIEKSASIDGYAGFLFITRNKTPMKAAQFQNIIRNARTEYQQLDSEFPDVTPHTFRHTYATNRVRKGDNPLNVYREMGHTSIETTMRYYVHFKDDEGIEINISKSNDELMIEYCSREQTNNCQEVYTDSNTNIIKFPVGKLKNIS
jgi:integrase